MRTNEKAKKSGIFKAIIILVILAVIALGVGFAYARYITKLNGQITAQVANWTLKINNTTDNQQFTINLAQTKDTQKSKSGNANYIEPGDQGAFDLVIDAEGTGVSLVYNMEIDISGMPKNLILYADNTMIHKIPVVDNSTNSVVNRKIKLEDYIGIASNSQTQTKRIYWQWPYESGTSDVEIAENDIDDSRYMGSSIEMSVSVSAKQIDVEPIYLAKKVSVGDLVNYNANVADANGNTFATPYTYATDSAITGSTTQSSFSSADSMAWKVLYKNEDFGIVELVSADGTPNELTLNDVTGFINAEKILNDISNLYMHGYGGIAGRSVTIDDVEQYSSFDKTTFPNDYSNTGYYGGTRIYAGAQGFLNEISKTIRSDGTLNIAYQTSFSDSTKANPIEITQTYYHYYASEYYSDENAYNMLFKTGDGKNQRSYWIATRSVNLAKNICGYHIRCVNNGRITSATLYRTQSSASADSASRNVNPVISLENGIKTNFEKNGNGEWDLFL